MTGLCIRRVATAILALATAVNTFSQATAVPAPATPLPTTPAPAPAAPVAPANHDDILSVASPAKPENPFSRFEIVSLGSFPIMLFYTGFTFDLGRYVANGFSASYAPWPFQNEYSAVLTDSDRLTRIGAAFWTSMIVGAIDAYLHAEKLKKARRLRAAAETLGASP